MRADARANKARIVDAARRVLERGTGGGMASVAKEAGVGQGTIYRHFASWDALVIEVHRADMAQLAGAAPALLEQHPPFEALRAWLTLLADYGRLKSDLSEAMSRALHETLGPPEQLTDLTALETLIAAAQEDGSVRRDCTAADVFLLVGFLWRMGDSPDRPARADRLLDVVLEGLRGPHAPRFSA